MKKDKYPKCGTCEKYKKHEYWDYSFCDDTKIHDMIDSGGYSLMLMVDESFGCILHSSLGCKK